MNSRNAIEASNDPPQRTLRPGLSARRKVTPAELKSARQRLGLSAEAFARIFGAHDGRTVRGWEHGSRNGLPAHIPRSVEILVGLALELEPVRRALGIA